MYFKNPPWDTHQTPPEVYDFIQKNPPGRALDLGCGTGTNVITLAKNGWQVTGIDFIPKAIRTARHRAIIEQVVVDFRVGDVTRLDGIDGYFDLILDIGCYHTLDTPGMQAYRDNIKRLLLPGGTYLIYLFFKSEDVLTDTGALETDLDPFQDFLELVHRQDGTERGIRKSSWLTYRNPL
jgi:SAM-dependent methyltransferase